MVMKPRCLLISDDLTGGADTGAQFAGKGFRTLLVTFKEGSDFDLSRHREPDVLVINTDSRGLRADRAATRVSRVFRNYDKELFPIIYKKIDSTLRGNIGPETDAILKATKISTGFMTPAFPEQGRTVADGILMVGGNPLALTEASSDAAAPVRESCVYRLLAQQSSHTVGWIDLAAVASGGEHLRAAVEHQQKEGTRIIVFDAVRRRDLTSIADAAFRMVERPLFVGSAGLAEEVAKKLSPPRGKPLSAPLWKRGRSFKHLFIISGSTSNVTHEQLKRVERGTGIPSFELSRSSLVGNEETRKREKIHLSSRMAESMARGHVILKTCPERLPGGNIRDTPIHLKIPRLLGHIALMTLETSGVAVRDSALIVTGGDTAISVFDFLGVEGFRIEGELLKGIVVGYVIGGPWNGLTVVTKAGAFGRANALRTIVDILEMESSQAWRT